MSKTQTSSEKKNPANRIPEDLSSLEGNTMITIETAVVLDVCWPDENLPQMNFRRQCSQVFTSRSDQLFFKNARCIVSQKHSHPNNVVLYETTLWDRHGEMLHELQQIILKKQTHLPLANKPNCRLKSYRATNKQQN